MKTGKVLLKPRLRPAGHSIFSYRVSDQVNAVFDKHYSSSQEMIDPAINAEIQLELIELYRAGFDRDTERRARRTTLQLTGDIAAYRLEKKYQRSKPISRRASIAA